MNIIKLLFLSIILSFFQILQGYNSKEIIEKSSINFVWIFKEKQTSDNSFIFPSEIIRPLNKANSANETIKTFEKIAQWRELNPSTTINIWYDSSLLNSYSINNTKDKLNELKINNINLIDINEKELLKQELPIYFRADIARVLASLTTDNTHNFFIYFDFSIDPIKISDLYEKDNILEKLEEFGMIMGQTEHTTYENSFFIIGSNNETTRDLVIKAFNKGMIEYFLNKPSVEIGEQDVWKQYPVVFAILNLLQNKIKYCKGNFAKSSSMINGVRRKAFIPTHYIAEEEYETIGLLNIIGSNIYQPCTEEQGRLVEDSNKIVIPTLNGVSKTSKFHS